MTERPCFCSNSGVDLFSPFFLILFIPYTRKAIGSIFTIFVDLVLVSFVTIFNTLLLAAPDHFLIVLKYPPQSYWVDFYHF